jgi:hypothetical protein
MSERLRTAGDIASYLFNECRRAFSSDTKESKLCRASAIPGGQTSTRGWPHEGEVGSWGKKGDRKMHPDGSVTSREFIRVRLRRLSAVPALLVCYAVVFNFGPFAKTSQLEIARETPRHSIAAADVAAPRAVSDDRPDHAQSSAAATGRVESIGSPADDVVRTSQQPLDLMLASAPVSPIPSPDTKTAIGPPRPATIEGIWAPNASSCSLRDLRDGSLATIIGVEGARAGDTYCAFKKQTQTPTGWRVVAICSNSLEHWTADVRLTVKDDHLTWISRRGRQIYTRCVPDVVRTAAR